MAIVVSWPAANVPAPRMRSSTTSRTGQRVVSEGSSRARTVTSVRWPSRGGRPAPTSKPDRALFGGSSSDPVHTMTGMSSAGGVEGSSNAVRWRSDSTWISLSEWSDVRRSSVARRSAAVRSPAAALGSVSSIAARASDGPPGMAGSHGSPARITQKRSSPEAPSRARSASASSWSSTRVSPTIRPLLIELSSTMTMSVGGCDPPRPAKIRRAPAPTRRSRTAMRVSRSSTCLRRILRACSRSVRSRYRRAGKLTLRVSCRWKRCRKIGTAIATPAARNSGLSAPIRTPRRPGSSETLPLPQVRAQRQR